MKDHSSTIAKGLFQAQRDAVPFVPGFATTSGILREAKPHLDAYSVEKTKCRLVK